jgi:hypothetical protein
MRKDQPVLIGCSSNVNIFIHFHNMFMLNSGKLRHTDFARKRFIRRLSL